MSDISYEILDLFKKYGSSRQGVEDALRADHRSQVLYALDEGRENLLEWVEFSGEDRILQMGSGYGALTGLLACRCKEVTVVEDLDENAQVNRQRNEGKGMIRFLRSLPLEEKGGFDWVILCGPEKEKGLTDQLQALAPFLKEDGCLALACANGLGLPYLSGAPAPQEEGSFSLSQVKEALLAAGLGYQELYYPMPDYQLPTSIFSRRYLPGAGDLESPAVSWEEKRYACLDEGKVYGELLSEGAFGAFAPAFLVIASREKHLQKTVFAKYNRTRKPEFQISTKILEEDGRRFVVKEALKEEGIAHVRSMEDKFRKLRETSGFAQPLKPEISGDGRQVRFSFLRGQTLDQQLAERIGAGEDAVSVVKEALEGVLGHPEEKETAFLVTPAFEEVFGQAPELTGAASCQLTNLDGLFENVMETENGRFLIDYEWVFDFPIPAGFIRWRLLHYFYTRHWGCLGGTEDEFLGKFGLSRELQAVYERLEQSFQAYVHGDGNQGYLANYSHPVITLEELKKRDQELDRARDRILQLQAEVEEKNLQIRKEQEVQRLTNNHVANLEVIIKDLRHEVDEVGKLATYLNRHEALIFKARRKLGVQVNKAFPKGTRKRKLLNYGINTVKHPIRYGKLYATAEGRNRINGDFQIGDAYLKYGRLVFPRTEGEPVVSIIIPCYNQVAYTYACLRSILEHTKDVPYEVIIADDVSTDATARLGQYVEGLVICRNKTNQGFLKNCNNAAKKARGKYLFFLNNDTQVTEGWLSALVDLADSDPTIGIAGSKLVYPDGRLQEAGGIIWSDASGWNYGRLDDPEKPEYNYVKEVDYISGAAILIPRKLWEQIGGFDERFAPAYYEDTDLAFEVRKAGYRVVYQPRSKVVHFEGISNGTDVNGTGLKRYQVENAKKFKEKWAEELKSQCVNDGNPNPFRARERSQGKKIILVVDHYVPTFDKDAGSKATYLYMKMFQKKGFVVKFLGDNFLHEEPYTTALEQLGIEVLYGDWYAAGIWDWLKKNGNEIAVAYLNRPHIATKYVDFIKDYTKIKVIYFGHDLHFLRLSREYELDGKIETKREADYWKSMEFSMMYKADMSYYPSFVEIDVIHSIDASIRAKAISLYVYDTFKEKLNEDFEKREGLLFVGGFAHPPNADAVLWFAREIFPAIRGELPDVNFYVVGSKVTDEIKALEQPGNGIVIKGFVSDEELERLYATCRVVVVPLRYGAGVKGKVLEALYNGAPVITTSIGAEGIPFVDQALKIEDTAQGFAAATTALYQDPEACRRMSRDTQEYMKKYFSLDSAWETIREDFTV